MSLQCKPSLSVYRPALNIAPEVRNDMLTVMRSGGISKRFGNMMLRATSSAMIISGGEILRLHEILGIEPSDAVINRLIASLDDALPESVDRMLTIPATPVKKYNVNNSTDIGLFTLCSGNVIAQAERVAAQAVIDELYGINDTGPVTHADAWQDSTFSTDIWLARMKGEDVIAAFEDVLGTHVSILPEHVSLDTVAIIPV